MLSERVLILEAAAHASIHSAALAAEEGMQVNEVVLLEPDEVGCDPDDSITTEL
jgi:hypothetical protein